MERPVGIEPTHSAWKAVALPVTLRTQDGATGICTRTLADVPSGFSRGGEN